MKFGKSVEGVELSEGWRTQTKYQKKKIRIKFFQIFRNKIVSIATSISKIFTWVQF